MDLLTAARRCLDGKLTEEHLRRMSKKTRAQLERDVAAFLRRDHQCNQLVYYQPINEDARRVHLSTAREVGITGGRRSGKTGLMMAEFAIQMTGVVPEILTGRYPVIKLRPPIKARLVVTSLVTAWDVNLKQKLQWFEWNGKINEDHLPGDPRFGMWGLIPQRFLIDGDWSKSWSEKHRMLTLTNGSTLGVMSWDQDIEEFNQGAFHLIGEDELPPEAIHRANRMRVLDYGGQLIIGGTPPDDRSASITAAWFHDEIYQPGLAGSSDDIFAVTLWTEKNPTLDAEDLAWVVKGYSPEQREARMHGKFLHLSGLVIKGFTEKPKTWCFVCQTAVYLGPHGGCDQCGSKDLTTYSHVWDDEDLVWPGPEQWPTLFYMDPHQARPTACAWFKVDPQDQWWQVAEAEIAGDAEIVKRECEAVEQRHRLQVVWRKGDPKITAQQNQFAQEFEGRRFTIREAFEAVGFSFEDANTSFTVAIDRIEQALRPNPYTRCPRLRIHRSCTQTIYHVTHHVWDARSRRENVDTKEKPSKVYSDFVALLRYMVADEPEHRFLQMLQARTSVRLAAAGIGRNRMTGW